MPPSPSTSHTMGQPSAAGNRLPIERADLGPLRREGPSGGRPPCQGRTRRAHRHPRPPQPRPTTSYLAEATISPLRSGIVTDKLLVRAIDGVELRPVVELPGCHAANLEPAITVHVRDGLRTGGLERLHRSGGRSDSPRRVVSPPTPTTPGGSSGPPNERETAYGSPPTS